jgi:hypothetical protein
MSRAASEPLRPLTEEEHKELHCVSRASSETRIRYQRAVALLAVDEGKSLSEAARIAGWKSHDPVTRLTRRFNTMGLGAPLRFAKVRASSQVWAGRAGPHSARSASDARPQGRC